MVIFGGRSEIGVELAQLLAPGSTVVLAARSPYRLSEQVAALEKAGAAKVDVREFDADELTSHAPLVASIVADHGPLGTAVLAFGVLGDQASFDADPEAAADAARINYVGAVSCGLVVADRLRTQGHGTLVVLSSVAAERARRSNYVYGSTKAGLDAFYTGLTEALRPHDVGVTVVRPGFVHTRMTEGMKPAPLSTTPEVVAAATVDAVRHRREQVWVPAPLRGVMSVLRHLPRPVFRRLPV